MAEGMTNAEFNAFLETLAQLIEAKAATPEEAAQIVRAAKAKKKTGLRNPNQREPQTQAQRRAGSLTPAALIVTRVRRKIKEEKTNGYFFLPRYRHRRRVAGLRRGSPGGMDRRRQVKRF